MASTRYTRRQFGFSIIELSIVITVMLIILAIIVPGYQHIVLKANEDTLREDLHIMRKMVDQYTVDKEKAPQALEDLVEAHYLPQVPVDPMTGSAETWEVILEDQDTASVRGERGIVDVKSGSTDIDSSGTTRYSDW